MENGVCFQVGERKERRKKKNHWQQIVHYLPSCTISRGRGHGGASKDIVGGQIWPLGGVSPIVQISTYQQFFG